jgi:heme/copper-type cytochrome/quinol oxidase subunit 2
MTSIFSLIKLLIAIPVLLVIICFYIFIRQFRSRQQGQPISDKQTVRLLVCLLLLAAISIGFFILIGFGKIGGW